MTVVSVSEGGIRLWPPPGAATIVLASAGLVVFSGVGGICLWMAGKGLIEPWVSRPVDVMEVLAGLGVAAIFLFAIYILGIACYMMLRILRHGYWLDGTVLIERRLIRKLRIDLSTVHADTEVDNKRNPVQYLVARAPDTGAKIRLPVTENQKPMATPKLTMVADVLTAGRDQIGTDAQAGVIADRLRRLAADPETRIDQEGAPPGDQSAPASDADAGIKGETGVRWLLLVFGIVAVTFAVIGGLGYLLGLGLFAPALALLVLLPGLRHFPREFRRRVLNKPDQHSAPVEADPPSAG